jgi:hypothetical protein
MAPKALGPAAFPCAGDCVEVIDRQHKLYGRAGTIAYFVGNNVYVTFAKLRWSKTRMFFPDQLRAVYADQEPAREPAAAGAEPSPHAPRLASAHAATDVDSRRDR